MLIDMICINESCTEKEKPVQVYLKTYKELDTLSIFCPKCSQRMVRKWTFAGGIKTNDGFKL